MDKKEIEFRIVNCKLAITKLINNDENYTPEEKRKSLTKLVEALYELEKSK